VHSRSGCSASTKLILTEDLLPLKVYRLFANIPDEDCRLLWLDPQIGRPENLILKNLLVPPVPIRPSVAYGRRGGSNEDDLTVKLQEIVDVNQSLELVLKKGGVFKNLLECWDLLQLQVAQYINGEIPGIQVSELDSACVVLLLRNLSHLACFLTLNLHTNKKYTLSTPSSRSSYPLGTETHHPDQTDSGLVPAFEGKERTLSRESQREAR